MIFCFYVKKRYYIKSGNFDFVNDKFLNTKLSVKLKNKNSVLPDTFKKRNDTYYEIDEIVADTDQNYIAEFVGKNDSKKTGKIDEILIEMFSKGNSFLVLSEIFIKTEN